MGLDIGSISLSGMLAGFTRLHVSADNVARRNVPNSEKNRVTQVDNKLGGTDTRIEKIPIPESEKLDQKEFSIYTVTNIDYAEEAILRQTVMVATSSSMAVYNKSDEMMEELISIDV